MGDVASAPPVVRFGVFELDLGAGELRKKGVRVRLQEQPLQVLALLLEQPGRVVTREELKRKLWAGTVVDFDHGLNTTINKLREALGDAADTPRFIETLPRRGYRFIYPLNGTPVELVETAAPRPRRRWAAGFVLAALLAVVVGLLALDVGGLRERLVGRAGATGIASIAVLPLKNLSGDPEQDYFVDGITEALISELGKVSALRVLSYQSVVGYRQGGKPPPQVARELEVNAFLEGGVLHLGERVRITASLVQASPERHLWAESYEFDLRDVLAVLGEVARDVASQTHVKLTPQEQAHLTTSRRVDPEAYEAYQLGRAHLSRTPTPASFARAKEYLEKAIRKDPGYAPAYAGLGELYIGHRGLVRNGVDARIQARQWGERALALDETLADAHTVLARASQQDWDWAGAEREYRRAIELNPSHALARVWYAMYLYAMLRFDEAAAEARRARQLDPVSPLVNTWAAATFISAGRVEDGIASAQQALELDPRYADASLVLGRTYVTQGKHERAIGELQKALIFNRQPHLLGALAHAYARAGHREEALKLLSELGRTGADERGYKEFALIWAHAGLGDKERAFAGLEKAFQERLGRMVWLNVDPLLEPLRSDPRFEDLARRVGLPARSPPQSP